MNKLEKLDSKLFENFSGSELNDISLVYGGATSKKDDCNASSYDDDNSRWGKDSTDASDTVRADDGCNEK
ncbi:MAG: hypothetical protein MK105_13575 [Crocinitomicaceae bacterium]|nr:hypothetical protein [Crocinitomicaceae bacterium]